MQIGEFTLRPHQERAIAAIRAELSRLFRAGLPPRVVVQACCGAGKTIIGTAIMHLGLERGSRSAFIAHGRQLIYQKSNTLTRAGINHSVLMAGEPEGYHDQVLVASKDTYESRVGKPLEQDIVIVDEAHQAMSPIWQNLLPADKVVIGLTATPAMPSGKGLGGFYKALVRAATYQELIEAGLIVPARVFAPWSVDYRGLAKNDGDWSWDKVAERFQGLTGDVVANWVNLGEDRPTAVFASNVEHSVGLCKEFNRAGVPAVHIDAETPQEERDEAFKAIADGRCRVLCNFGVLTVGFDLPVLSCAVLAFSTASLVKYLQVCGRVLRSFPEKKDAKIIDHGDNVRRHGWPTEDHDWSLDEQESVSVREARLKAGDVAGGTLITCAKCGAVRQGGNVCEHCGNRRERRGALLKTRSGELVEIKPKDAVRKQEAGSDEKVWCQCLGIAANCHMTISQAMILFKKRQGHWPSPNLRPMPTKHKWTVLVSAVYPGFVRRKVLKG